jgi:DNA polymerase-4
LKIKYFDFQAVTRRQTFDHFLASAQDIFSVAKDLLERTEAGRRPVRLAGISLSNFQQQKKNADDIQPGLFKS